jgi:hypothetical protein
MTSGDAEMISVFIQSLSAGFVVRSNGPAVAGLDAAGELVDQIGARFSTSLKSMTGSSAENPIFSPSGWAADKVPGQPVVGQFTRRSVGLTVGVRISSRGA